MGVFEHFPYVNFHELNLSWIVNKLKELEDIIGSQIVDIVARAGVAANAQAIQDLSDTVDDNAVTAHNEAQAASNAAAAAQTSADAAQGSADQANNGVAAINTFLAHTSGNFVKDPNISAMEGWYTVSGNVCSFYASFTNGNVQLSGGTAVLATGLPIPFNGRVQGLGDVTLNGSFDRVLRVAVQTNGNLSLWYGGNLPANEVMTVQMTYIIA